MKARLLLIAGVASALAPLDAAAQAWVTNPDFSEGVGIRAGNFELHPGIGAEFGYDSNYFRSSGDGPNENIVDVFTLRVTPSLSLSTLSPDRRNAATPPKVTFKAGAHATYNEVFAADSENSDVSKRRNIGMGADAKVDVFPSGKVGFDVVAAYVRTIDADGNSEDLAGEGFNRDTLRGGAGVTWRPGGGTFTWRTGYNITYNFLEGEEYSDLANLHHEINTRGRWKFLPRSALLFDGSYGFIRYTHADTPQNDGDFVRARIGFHGLITYHLALLGMAGWSSSFYEDKAGSVSARQYDSIVANAEARWFIQSRPNLEDATITSGLSSVALGYQRSFSNSYYGSYYQRDRGYLQGSMFLLGAIVGGAELGVSRVGYPEVVSDTGTTPAFAELRLDARVFGEYRFTDTIAANTSFYYDTLSADTQPNGEDLSYSRWQWFVGVRWFM